MKLSEVIYEQLKKSGVEVREVSPEKIPSKESLRMLEIEIADCVTINEAVSTRSMLLAAKAN